MTAEYKKVLQRADKIQFIIIPKAMNLKKGQYVKIIKVEDNEEGSGE